MSTPAENGQAPGKVLARTGNTFLPSSFGELVKYAEYISKSALVPKDFKDKPHDVVVAVQWGMELGLHPLQALQNICVINGRPSIWGDLTIAIVQSHPDFVDMTEKRLMFDEKFFGYSVTVKRKGKTDVTRQFTIDDAKKAGLIGKSGTWTTYTERMVYNRARAFAVRDQFADALKGMSQAEEAMDIQPEAREIADAVALDPTPMPRSKKEAALDKTASEVLAAVEPEPEPEGPVPPAEEVTEISDEPGPITKLPDEPEPEVVQQDLLGGNSGPPTGNIGEPLKASQIAVYREYARQAGINNDDVNEMLTRVHQANFAGSVEALKVLARGRD